MATAMVLTHISQQLNIYWGLAMLFFGIIGNLWNMLTLRHHSLRYSSYCTYMFILSFFCLIHLLFSLSDRIIHNGFNINWTENSVAWCKIRYYAAQSTSLIALSYLVFSAADRFFSTCCQIRWRRLSTVSFAQHLCLFTSIFWLLLTIPALVYMTPVQYTHNKQFCHSSSTLWLKIVTYVVHLCCRGIFPWVLMSVFSLLTLKNVQSIRHRRIGTLPAIGLSRTARTNTQLTSMLFLHTIICILSSMPYITQNIYENLTKNVPKDEHRLAAEYMFLSISRLTFYFNYIFMFYANYLSSAMFRKLSKQVLINLFKRQEDASRQITMVNHQDSRINNHNQIGKRQISSFIIQPLVISNSRV